MQRQDVKGGKSTQGCGQQAAAPPRTALQQSFSGNLSHYFMAFSLLCWHKVNSFLHTREICLS